MTAPKPGQHLRPTGRPCTAYLPQLDEDGTNWRVWCILTDGHDGHHESVAGWQFEADGTDDERL